MGFEVSESTEQGLSNGSGFVPEGSGDVEQYFEARGAWMVASDAPAQRARQNDSDLATTRRHSFGFGWSLKFQKVENKGVPTSSGRTKLTPALMTATQR